MNTISVMPKTVNGIIISLDRKEKTDSYSVVYGNAFLKDNGVDIGDSVFIRPKHGVSVWLDGKEHTWLRNSDTLAKIEEDGE